MDRVGKQEGAIAARNLCLKGAAAMVATWFFAEHGPFLAHSSRVWISRRAIPLTFVSLGLAGLLHRRAGTLAEKDEALAELPHARYDDFMRKRGSKIAALGIAQEVATRFSDVFTAATDLNQLNTACPTALDAGLLDHLSDHVGRLVIAHLEARGYTDLATNYGGYMKFGDWHAALTRDRAEMDAILFVQKHGASVLKLSDVITADFSAKLLAELRTKSSADVDRLGDWATSLLAENAVSDPDRLSASAFEPLGTGGGEDSNTSA